MKKALSILLAASAILSMVLTGCSSTATLNLSDYLIVKTKGVDGYGEIEEYTLDYKAIAEKYGSRGKDSFVLDGIKTAFNTMQETEISKYVMVAAPEATQKLPAKSPNMKDEPTIDAGETDKDDEFYEEDENYEENDGFTGFVWEKDEYSTHRYTINDVTNLEDAAAKMFEYNLPRLQFEDSDKNDSLSNGDVVNFSWTVDEEDIEALENIFKIKIKCEDVKYKVEELTELLKIDPFKNVEFLFNGKNGTGTVSSTAYVSLPLGDRSVIKTVEVELPENNGSLSNGDKLHVKITNIDAETLAKSYGAAFTKTEADVPLRGLNAYGQAGAKHGEKATINLNDYVTIITMGDFETLGSVQVNIDYKGMLIENLAALSENVAEEYLCGYESSKLAALEILKSETPYKLNCVSHNNYSGSNSIDVYSDPGFSNGQEVKFAWEIDNEKLAKLQKVMNVEFKFDDITYTTEGLRELREIDPFENYEISYDGDNGSATIYGYAKFYPNVNDPEYEITEEFEIISDKNGYLSNGDKVILSLKSYTEAGNFIYNWGIVPTRTELEITVSGLE